MDISLTSILNSIDRVFDFCNIVLFNRLFLPFLMVYMQTLWLVGDSVVQKCSIKLHMSKIVVYIDSLFISYLGALHE